MPMLVLPFVIQIRSAAQWARYLIVSTHFRRRGLNGKERPNTPLDACILSTVFPCNRPQNRFYLGYIEYCACKPGSGLLYLRPGKRLYPITPMAICQTLVQPIDVE